MPKLSDKPLTDTYLRNLKPPAARKDIYDAIQRGLGLRLAPSGTKTWFAMRRVDGRMKRVTIGRYPEISLADARREAESIFQRISSGEVAKPEAIPTFGAAMERWFQQEQASRRTVDDRRRSMANDAMPYLGNKPIDTITKADIRSVLDRVVKRGAPIHANRLLAYLRRMFNWAVEQDIIAVSPANGIKKPAEEKSRDRTLKAKELAAVFKAAGELGEPFGAYVKLLILTGQRRSEVAGARWTEFDLDKGEWIIPGERAKNGKAHLVHLSDAAIAILSNMPRLDGSDYVFTTTGQKPISGFSKIKVRLDVLSGVTGWTLHDLRRTFATIMTGDLGIEPIVIDRILGHASGAVVGVALVYMRHQYSEQRRAAMDAWGGYIDELSPKGEK